MNKLPPEVVGVFAVAAALIATLSVAEANPAVISMVILLSLTSAAAGAVFERHRRPKDTDDDRIKQMLAAIREDQLRAKRKADRIDVEVEAEDEISNDN